MNNLLVIFLTSLATSIGLGLIIIPILRRLKVGQIERTDGPESHLKKQGTPTMGGLIIALTMLIVYGVYAAFFFKTDADLISKIIPLVFVTIGFGVIGFLDDFIKLVLKNTKGLKPSYKMIGLLAVSVIYTIYLLKFGNNATVIKIPFFGMVDMPVWLYVPFVIFVLLGTTNAVNLTDGVDGLAGNVVAIILSFLVFVSYLVCPQAAFVATVLIGACLGFLVFNLHPAKVFMGDTGSLMLGGAISGIAIYLNRPFLLIPFAIIPIIETVSVMLQVASYKLTKKRIFKMAPIHHHFELSGWKESKVVFIFSAVTFISCVLGVVIGDVIK